MKLAQDLTKSELADLVTQLQEILFLQPTEPARNGWEPEKEWNSETFESIGGLMADFNLRPEQRAAAECLGCGRARVRPGVRFCLYCSGRGGV